MQDKTIASDTLNEIIIQIENCTNDQLHETLSLLNIVSQIVRKEIIKRAKLIGKSKLN